MTITPLPVGGCGSTSPCKRRCYPPMCNEPLKDIRIDDPYFDMCTFKGRFAHFFAITNPTGAFRSSHSCSKSSNFIFNFRHGRLKQCLTEQELWHHRYVEYANTHEDTREVYHPLTRYPHQPLVNALIAAGMLSFTKTYASLALWQVVNQSYQNYTAWNHRKIPSCISDRQAVSALLMGSAGSVATVVGLKYAMMKYFLKPPSIVPKLIPLAGVLVGNMLAVPTMHAQKLKYGMPVLDHMDKQLGYSVLAAKNDVSERIAVRNMIFGLPLLAAPFLILPFRKDTSLLICKYPFLRKVLLMAMLAGLFTLSTPFALSLYQCPGQLNYCDLEKCLRRRVERRFGNNVPRVVFYRNEC